jgi:protein phosphatase
MKQLSWKWSALSDAGRVRAGNEDSVFAAAESGVFVVADGMGGHAAGEVASAIASTTIGSTLCSFNRKGSTEEARERFVSAFLDAGREIERQSQANRAHVGMGTTATVLLLLPEHRYMIGHLGDSRAYVLRDGTLLQLTRDHSWVQEQVDRGMITPEQAQNHPQSNIITRALGSALDPRPDIYVGDFMLGDMFLISSDGLTDMLPERAIQATLESDLAIELKAARLVSEANLAGGFDNITVLLVNIVPAAEHELS